MAVDAFNRAARRLPPWLLYLVGPLPALWLYFLGVTGQLSIDPVKDIEHQLGLWALQLVILSLVVTPLRRFTGINLMRFRRAIGLLAFFYVTLHLLTWLLLDIQLHWGEIWKDIVKRPYITIGMLGFVMMLPLAVTSNNWSVRRLGAAGWRRVHWLAYPVAVAGAAHYMMLVKAWPLEPILYCLGVAGLLVVRLRWRRWFGPEFWGKSA